MKKRHYLKLYKRSGEFIDHVVGFEKFSDEDKKDWLEYYKADYATEEERFSLV